MQDKKLYELTNPQKSIWYTEEVFKGTTINNICTSAMIFESVDVELLKRAINLVVNKNDSFRIHIVSNTEISKADLSNKERNNIESNYAQNEKINQNKESNNNKQINKNEHVYQYIADCKYFDVDVEYINIPSELEQIEAEEANHYFNIIDSDLFKFKIVVLKGVFTCIILTVNHIIADSWSLGLTIQEILRNYNCLKNNKISDINEYSYIDFINSEKEYKQSSKYQKDKAYWNKIFETIPEQATIPGSIKVDSKRANNITKSIEKFASPNYTENVSSTSSTNSTEKTINTSSSNSVEKLVNTSNSNFAKRLGFNINKNLVNKIATYCKENHFSAFNFFMAIYSIYISRVTNANDFAIGTPILNRTNYKEKHTAGMMVSTVPIRVSNVNSGSFIDLANSFSEKMMGVLRHQKYSYNAILDDLRAKNGNIPGLYNIVISYQVTKAFNESFGAYVTNWNFNNYCANDLNIHISDINNTGNLLINYDYLTSKYTSKDIQDIHKRVIYIINQVLENNEILTKDVEIVTKQEKTKILNLFDNTDANYPKDKTIVDLFEEQVEKTPDNTAVMFEDKKLTYKELNEKANSLARYLIQIGVKPKDIVGLRIDKSIEMVIGILAIIKTGGCYLPINMQYPQDRVQFMLKDSNAKILLGNLKSLNEFELNINKVDVSLTNQDIYNYPTHNLGTEILPTDLIYIIYTSGSTGTPKGAMIMHKNVVRLLKNDKMLFDFSDKDVWTLFHSIAFDFSVWEMYGALLYGGKLLIVPDYVAKDPNLFLNLMEKEQVTVLNQTPTYFYNLLNAEVENPHSNLIIRYIVFGGEALKPTLVAPWHKLHPNTKLINMYGITETTVHVTFKELSETDLQLAKSNIGLPIPTLKILLLDKNLKLVPPGTPGEICVCGDGVFKGYLNRDDLNNTKLIPNPYNPNEIMYRSADVGVYSNNSLEYIGRMDTQVKIRGFRVELGEIEEKILKYRGIKSCIVTTKKAEDNHDLLCAYYIKNSSNSINISELRSFLRQNLPTYMIPQYFIEVSEWPYNHNGKIDKKKLPIPEYQNYQEENILPRNEVDKKLISLLQNMLNANSISIESSFFEIGGDSLFAINLCAEIQHEFGVNLYVKDILENPIIKDLSDIIGENLNTSEVQVITPIPKAESYYVSFAQKRIFYASQFADNSCLYNIPAGIILEGELDISKLENCFNILINRHEALRTYFELKDNNVVQKILSNIQFNMDIIENANFENLSTLFKDFVKPFDLKQAPLFRAKLICFTNKKYALFVDMHHIISDGTSTSILVNELCNLYNGENLPEIKITYKDFAVFEQERLSSKHLKDAEKYWLNQFADDIPTLNMPTQYPRPSVQSFEGKKIYSSIDAKTVQKLEQLANSLSITPYMLLLSCYYILLSKYTSSEDIVVGTPVVGRDIAETYNIIGMFVNTLALRNKIDNNLTFKDFVLGLKENILEAYKYQTYPFDELVNKLNITRDASRNPLFDVMFVYQNNGYKDINFKGIKSEYYTLDTGISKFDLSLEAIPCGDEIKLSFEYATKLFDADFIQNLSNHYLNILNSALENIYVKIADISMLSEYEQNKILYKFNNTKADYPKDKTIVNLFEEQAEKTPDNIALVFENKNLTYKELNEKANSLAYYLRNTVGIKRNDLVGIMVNRSLEMIISIIAVLKSGGAYIPIDPTYPEDRIKFMLNSSNSKILLIQEKLKNKIDFSEKIYVDLDNTSLYKYQIQNLEHINDLEDLSYVIFTSGSTGTPKGVMLKHKALANLANYCNNYIEYLKNPSYQSIVSTTTVSFDIFIFETLISLQKGLKLVITNEKEQNSPDLLNHLIEKYDIKIIQLTPSRMQILLDNIKNIPLLKNLKYITLAGEQLPLNLLNTLHKISDITIYNGYGPSETTVFSTLTKMKKSIITIGKPLYNTQIYILDKNKLPVPIGVSGEIYISGDGVGKGYLNNDILTKKSFIKNPFIPGTIMYKTGDMGKYRNDGTIICQGRLDNQVKIRGLRIELGEIEDKIQELPFINACVVVKKVNKVSHEFLCAYYTANSEIKTSIIKQHLKRFLPRYMIPQYFMQLDKLPYTPNGKIDRKKLPDIKYQNSEKAIVLPRNEIDSKLINILSKVLRVNNISINDNFFEIGGDSLSAINLCAKIQNEFNVHLFVKDILEHPIIQNLSDIIDKSINTYQIKTIKSIPTADYYMVSSAQKRIYFASQVAGISSTLYNISVGIILDGSLDISKLEHCINILIDRHEALRTYFELNDNTVVQKIIDKVQFKINVAKNAKFSNLSSLFKKFVRPFDLSKAPLLRAEVVSFTPNKHVMFIDMHHIISDGTSISILADELCKLYNDESLPELKITYKDFAAFENENLNLINEAENYWIKQFKDTIPVLNMPTQHPRPAVQSFEGKKIYSTINTNTVGKIEKLSKDLRITPYMILLSCYYILLSKYTSSDDIVIGSPVVGRNIADTYNLIGMFVNTLALRNKIDNNLSFKDFILNVKENVLNAYKYQTYPFDELVNKLSIKRDTSRNPLFDVMFIYQNNGFKDLNFKGLKSEYYAPDTGISKFDLSLEAMPVKNQINLCFEYATKLFDESFIQNLSNHYLNILNFVLDNIDTKISKINMLSQEEQNKLLYEFNATSEDYPRNKTIAGLFEEQVEKTPNNIAIIFEGTQLTYKELNEKANSLAYYLRNIKKISKNDLVGIMVNRSLEMIIAILAVLKSGGAYIPIDPTYPTDRIKYMLNNSSAKVLLTQKHLDDKLEFENKIFVDLSHKDIYDFPTENLNNINNPKDLAYVIFTSGSTGLPKGVMLEHKALSNLANYCNNYIEYLKNPSYKSIISITTISFDIFIFETIISLQKGLKLVIANENEQNTPKLLNRLIEKYDIKIIQSTPSRMQIFIDNINDMPSLKNLEYIILAGEQLPIKLVKTLKELTNGIIYNGYGPSETTVFSTLTKMNTDIVTIGKPLNNTQIYILDTYLNPVPIGISGEIYISGDGVGRGYLNNEDLTKKSFIKNPFISGSIMYKTGDIGIYTNNGNIICLGRSDNQIKIRGLRIELGEIENLILNYPNIKNACVIKQSLNNRELLCAYFVSNHAIVINDLRKYLSLLLPNYMVPAYFIAVDNFPYTPNGKIDKKALQLSKKILDISKTNYVAPETKLEKDLVKIWEELLFTKPIGINDNFFELGGDSLLAMNLNIELLKISDKITYQDIFSYPTIAELEEKINSTYTKPLFDKIENLSDNFVNILEHSTQKEKANEYHPKNILLTGSTGFLGIHLLKEFIENEKGNIYCIIRQRNNASPKSRLIKKLNYYFGNTYNDLIDNRIFVINGNITEPNFGLNNNEILHLANSVDLVINSAATVSHYGNYKDFYNTNVKSVEYIIDFCNHFNKKLYHISTKSVTGLGLDLSYPSYKKSYKRKIKFNESYLYIGQTLDNLYAYTKFKAEKNILNAMSKGLDAYILRLGLLMPRFEDGVFQENVLDNDLINKIISFMNIGIIPNYLTDYKLDLTPVDCAAKAIYKLIVHPTKTNKIFHLYNQNTISVHKLLKVFKKYNYNINVLTENEFKHKIELLLNDKNSKYLLKNLINDFDDNMHLKYKTNLRIDSKFTIRYLKRFHFKWPKITNKYLINLIDIIRKVIE